MNRILFIIVALAMSLGACAQTKVSPTQQKEVLEKIDKAASSMKSMQCDFTQTKRMKMLNKEMLSKGMMYFRHPNQLRWQYNTPYDYIFILNKEKVSIKSAKTTQNIDVQQNKMFRQITNIILNSITAGNLKNTADFNAEIYQSGKSYFARLYPKKKELKQIYRCIELHFNPTLSMVNSVVMEEKTGDVTIVQLFNIKTNININERMFDTH